MVAICDGNDEELIEPTNAYPDDNDPADLCDIKARFDDNIGVCTNVNVHYDDNDPAVHLKTLRCKHAKNLIISLFIINSLRYKFSELQHILHRKFVDIFGIAETKIDDSFLTANFK